MKIAILLSLVTLVSACDIKEIDVTNNTRVVENVETICIDNVTYVKFSEGGGYTGYGYMSVKLDTNSKIILCGEAN